MVIQIFLIILGFACLIFGAHGLVDGASALAKKFKVSDLAIGLTIVAFGTSAPELVVSVIGSLQGYSDIVVGNVLGSNNFNLFIILGISGLVLPIAVQSSTARTEIPISLFVATLLLFFINDFTFSESTQLSRLEGGILLFMFFAFLYYVFLQMKSKSVPILTTQPMSSLKIAALILFGMGGLVVGGHLVITNSVSISVSLGASEKIIGLTIVAAGTSLPELVTSIVAAVKKNSDIAIGNVIGSNIFNILLILSISTLIKPIDYNSQFNVDLYILIGGTAFLFLAMLTGKRKRLDRWEAALLLGFYLAYTTYLIMGEA